MCHMHLAVGLHSNMALAGFVIGVNGAHVCLFPGGAVHCCASMSRMHCVLLVLFRWASRVVRRL